MRYDCLEGNMNQQREEYLAKTIDAEHQAAKSKDTAMRDSWLRIAASYRDLAKRQVSGT